MTTSQDPNREHPASAAGVKPAHRAETPVEPRRHRAASYDRGVQVAAARLRLVTDRQLGLDTPGWVKKLAAG